MLRSAFPILFALALTAAGQGGAANAAPRIPATDTAVIRTDANLATPEGAARALRQITVKARVMCDEALPHWGAAYLTCRDEAIASAVARLNAPLVSSLYSNKARRQAADVKLTASLSEH